MKIKHTFLVVAVIALVFLISCGGGESESSKNKEPVYVYWYCEDANYVQAGREIALYYEWITQTKEQNEAYFDVADHYLSVDGVPLEIKEQGFGEIMELADGTFKQMF